MSSSNNSSAQDTKAYLRLIRSHEMAVVGDRLFIDGGNYYGDLLNTSSSPIPVDAAGSGWSGNPNLYSVDLTESLTSTSYNSILSRINIIKKPNKPNVTSGALVSDLTASYLFHLAGQNSPAIAPGHFWSFDAGSSLFHAFLQAPNSTIQSYDGAAASSGFKSQVFYYGGIRFNGRISGDLIAVDMVDGSGELLTAGDPVSGSTMVWLPFGAEGVLVSIGGADSAGNAKSMETVEVFDIGSNKWFSQNTTSGSDGLPSERKRFCAVTPRKSDGSSHEIVIRGGTSVGDGYDAATYNDVWALSLPSFSWVKYYTGTKNTKPSSSSSSSPPIQRGVQAFEYNQTCTLIHDTYMTWMETAADDSSSLLGFFDITNPQSYSPSAAPGMAKRATGKGYVYDASRGTYSIPSIARAAIKGRSSPAAGWADGLEEVFSQKLVNPATSSQRSSSRHLSGGAISGIVLGSVLVASLFVFGIWWMLKFVRRRDLRSKRATYPDLPPPPIKHEFFIQGDNYQELGGQSISELESKGSSPSDKFYQPPIELPVTPIRTYRPKLNS